MPRLVIALLLTISCSGATKHVVLDPADGSVLTGPEVLQTLQQCSHYAPLDTTATWVPTSEQLKELELRMPRYVWRQRFRPPGEPDDYYRQYVGVVLGGRQFIYINAFPKDAISGDVAALQQFFREHPEVKTRDFPASSLTIDGWRSHAVVVCDGGSAYWGALYDPERKQFSKYSANGLA